MSSGIYIIQCCVNGRVYVGQSKNLESRLKDHMYKLRNKRHENIHLQRAFNKHGEKAFIFNVCITCSIVDLDRYERFYISLFNSLDFGFNMDSGGNLKKVISLESRNKMSKAKLGKPNGRKGIKFTDEQKLKLSIAHKGLPSPKKGIKTNRPAWNSGKKGLQTSSKRKKINVINRETGENIGNFESIQHFQEFVNYKSKNIIKIDNVTRHLGKYLLKSIV